MTEVTSGQRLIERVEKWIKSYVVFPEASEDAALVCALFVVNSWIYQVWDSTPYMTITAATKGAAKTVLMEVITMLCKAGKVVTDPTPSVCMRMLEINRGWMTLSLDEAEKLSSNAASSMRNFLNSGYRKGQTFPRSLPGQGIVDYEVYCPKIFALIGDVYSTLRDRSIMINLVRATPAQLQGVSRYRYSDATREASAIVPDIEAWVSSLPAHALTLREATWVSGRDEELWTPLVSTAHALGLDKAHLDRLTRISADLTAGKTQAARRYTDIAQLEDDAQDASYGEKALRDLRRVLKEGERSIFSSVAVQRMRELPDGPWRAFKGDGLNENRLADLVSRFGVAPKLVRQKGKLLRGYAAKQIGEALK